MPSVASGPTVYNSLTRREASAALRGGSERSPEDRRVGRGLREPLERRAVGGIWFLCEGGVRCVEEGGGGGGVAAVLEGVGGRVITAVI